MLGSNRFDYVRYDATAKTKQEAFKALLMNLEHRVINQLPAGRAQSLVLTKLEEAYMWIGKAIRDEQVQNRGAELQEERGNE